MAISRCNTAGFRLLLGPALIIVTWLALTPDPVVPMSDDMPVDKWGHFAAFLLLAYLVDASWPAGGFGPAKWAGLVAYAIALEFAQTLVPNRVFDLWDIGANLFGVALYALLLARLFRSIGLR